MHAMRKAIRQETTLRDLPNEVLLNIFDDYLYTFPVREPHRYYGIPDDLDRNTLYNLRLVCQKFNAIISPLLCPVLTVDLSSASMVRLEGLLSNDLIARGVRGIDISLRFRPRSMAKSFLKFYSHADSIISDAIRECDWHTEFQDYEEDDKSEDAVAYRDYLGAMGVLDRIQYAWQIFVERNHSKSGREEMEYGLESPGMLNDCNALVNEYEETEEDLKAQALLQRSFSDYSISHEDQLRIVADGSFVQCLKIALSRCAPSPYIWFNDNRVRKYDTVDGAIPLTTEKDALHDELIRPHKWLTIESDLWENDDDDTDLFFPGRIMTALPIACHNASIKLRGLQFDCFPLLRGYSSLIPDSIEGTENKSMDPWALFAAACNGLEVFSFGARGFRYTPLRPHRQSTSDMAIINSCIGSACSGPYLKTFSLRMSPFTVRISNGEGVEELHYPVSPILGALRSTCLRSISLSGVDVREYELAQLVNSISASQLDYLYFSIMTLSSGSYGEVMCTLRKLVTSRQQISSSKPQIRLYELQGAEFGKPSTLPKSDSWMYNSDEDGEGLRNKVEEQQRQALLMEVEEWIETRETDKPNPLSEFSTL